MLLTFYLHTIHKGIIPANHMNMKFIYNEHTTTHRQTFKSRNLKVINLIVIHSRVW